MLCASIIECVLYLLLMFFPIASIDLNAFFVFITGLAGGFVSGFLGIGCGIIITPVLMQLGVPPVVAISTQLCHAVGTNFSGFLLYKRKNDVDFALGGYILLGGCLGAICEWITLKFIENSDTLFQKFAYIYTVVLLIFGFAMLYQSSKFKYTSDKKIIKKVAVNLPFRYCFKRSRIETSVLIPISVGLLTGLIVSSLGGGGNLFMTPIVTYLIGRISPVVHGVTMLAGSAITCIISIVYAAHGYSCDFLFVLTLFSGAIIGSWLGVHMTYKVSRVYIHVLASIVIFFMAGNMAYKVLFTTPKFIHQTHNIQCHAVLEKIITHHKVLYTLLCIVSICAVAVVTEKILQKINDKLHILN